MTTESYNNFGLTTYDNIATGYLALFTIITLEGWTDLMYMVSKLRTIPKFRCVIRVLH